MFLTLEDPRARIQGSRDPLGLQPIWVRFGREVVTNLTTVSSAVRGFSVVLLGRFFAERLIEDGRAGEEDAIPLFMRTEQACAYARSVRQPDDHGDAILGVTRVRRFLKDHSGKVPIQNNASGFILSDQKTYGLWGLYSVAARVSGLLDDGPIGLTPVARDFVQDEYMPSLRPVDTKLTNLILRGGTLDTHRGRQPFEAIAKTLPSGLTSVERDFFGDALRDARRVERPNAPQRQQSLAQLLKSHAERDHTVGRTEIDTMARRADVDGELSLAEKLRRILRTEATLAPAEAIFDLILTRNGQTVSAVAGHIRDHWGNHMPFLDEPIEPMMSDIRHAAGEENANDLQRCDHALAHNEYEEAILALLDLNRVVMASRGAPPWVQLNRNELDVRYRGLENQLPSGDELGSLWRNSYFIGALKDITFQLEHN